MSGDKSDNDGMMTFVDEGKDDQAEKNLTWRVLIIDDERDVHSATTFALRSTEVVGRPLEFLHATSAREAKEVLKKEKDVAVILLDVVMETPNAGLDLVPMIRDELSIKDTRIILRTGQPNQAPEIEVIRDYDINDYKLKSELTQSRLFASLTTAIRSYKQIQTIEAGKKSLAMIVKSSAQLLTENGLHDFAQGVIMHLSGLLSIAPEGLICARRRDKSDANTKIIAAAGHYKPLIDRPLTELDEQDAQHCLLECLDTQKNIYNKHGIALYLGSEERGDMACFVSSAAELDEVDEHLLELFCSNITICADNLGHVTQLNEYAFHDGLTGLPNRNSLVEYVTQQIDKGNAKGSSLCLIDVDSFSEINTSLGQDYGDSLLQSIASKLRAQFPEPHFIARIFGDTFAICGDSNALTQENIIKPFDTPFELDGEEQLVSVTAGIVPLDEVHGDGAEAVKDATIVLKTAKSHGHGEVLLFRHNMIDDAQQRLGMLRHLRDAFKNEQLFLVFQPKLCLRDMEVKGFEALIRWRGQDGNLISPDTFIPLAEQSGLIVELGEWILKKALLSLKELHAAGWVDRHMSVNLSVAQLQHANILTLLEQTCQEVDVPPEVVNLEVTESMAISDLEATVTLLNEIKGLGFTLSLDDFGTGYSSLNLLHKLPIDFLKLDRSLVEASNTERGCDIVEMIIQLAGKIGMEVIAEGVEESSQVDFLKSLDCDHAQGFYYAKPMEMQDLLVWLKDQKNKSV